MQDTKFYLGIGIPKKGFGSSMPASDFRMICALLISCAVDLFSFYFSYLFIYFFLREVNSIFLNFIHCFIQTLFQYFLRGVLCTTRNKTEKKITGKKLFTNAFYGSDAPIEAVAKI